jgi:hypothetical protein
MDEAKGRRVASWRFVTRRLRHPGGLQRTPLASLEAATPLAVGALAQRDIHTAEDLWNAVQARDLDEGLRRCSQTSGVDESLLIDLLLESARRRQPLVRLADVLTPGLVVLAGVLVLLRIAGVFGFPVGAWGPTPLHTPQVVANKSLPVFHRVTGADLVVEEKARRFGAATDTSQVVGRYTMLPVRKGEPVSLAGLSARTANPAGSSVVALPLASGGAHVEASAGERVQFLFAPTPAGTGAGLRPLRVEGLLLGISRTGADAVATAALSPGALDSIGPLLAASQLYIVQRAQ